jgi:hypothetical protein
MPKGYKGNIEYGGQVLMERDARLTAQSRAIDKRAANTALNTSKQIAGLMPASNIADMSHPEAIRKTGVRSERLPVVNETMQSNAYTVDDE